MNWFPVAGPTGVFENKEARISAQGLTACIRRSAASAAAVRGSRADVGAPPLVVFPLVVFPLLGFPPVVFAPVPNTIWPPW